MHHDTAVALRSELASAVTAPTPRRTGRRMTIGAVGLAVVLAGSSLLQPGAYAKWTPYPEHPGLDESAEMREACLETLSGIPDRLPEFQTLLTERRGDWDLVLLSDEQGRTAVCLTSFRGGGGSYSPDLHSVPVSNSFTVAGERASLLDTSLWESMPKAEGHMLVFGRADGLTKLVVHTLREGDVTATIGDGWWVAWWPNSRFGVNAEAELEQIPGAQATYQDGRVVELDAAGWLALRDN